MPVQDPWLKRPIVRLALLFVLGAGLAFGPGLESQAMAQQQPGGMGPGSMPGGPGGGAGGGPKEKKEGPAEAAPKDKQALTPITPVPAQPKRTRRLQLFELDGFLRMRADYFHRLDMALSDRAISDEDIPPKFFKPPAETSQIDDTGASSANTASCRERLIANGVTNNVARRCDRRRGFSSANMRLRLSPTLHITDSIRVHTTIDALDNLVLGSTPDSFYGSNPYAPIDLYTRSQTPPETGINSFQDSLTVKWAWGHVKFGWGMAIDFGRMPQHWGLGIVFNDGNGYDRGEKGDIVRMLDQDYGDSVDSVRLSFDLGKDRRRVHKLGVSYDWASSGATTAHVFGPEFSSGNALGQEFSVEKFDNVHQFSMFMERRDSPAMLKRKLSLNRPVVNYGAIAWLRFQDVDRVIGAPGIGDDLGTDPGVDSDRFENSDGLHRLGAPLSNGGVDSLGRDGFQNYANKLAHRKAWVLTPDIWLRVNWRTLRVELEGAMVFGRFNTRDLSLNPYEDEVNLITEVEADNMERQRMLQGGYALEFKYGLFDDRFHLGLDHGFASGDESPPLDGNPQSPYLVQQGVGGSETSSGNNLYGNFRFNPAYMQDLLLFREVLGTVSNAVYFRPWAAFYFFQDNMSARVDVQYALGQTRSGTPSGAGINYGLELNGAARYHDADEPIFIQAQYGVLFPFKAMNLNGADAKAAQTVQGQIGIKF